MKAEELANTVMLHENNRMNKSLNDFTQRLYNSSYKSSQPFKSLPLLKQEDIEFDKLSSLSKSVLYPILYQNNEDTTTKIKHPSLCTFEVQIKERNNKNFPISLPSEFQLRYECDLIERIIDGFLSLCKKKPSIFIVVPHRSQRTSIKLLLDKSKYYDLSIQADTVDRMQGQEADIVIVSYLFFDSLQVASESEFLFDKRRLNVSISRAENFCLFIGTAAVFDPPVEVLGFPTCGDAYQHLMHFVESCQEINTFIPIQANLQQGIIIDDYSE